MLNSFFCFLQKYATGEQILRNPKPQRAIRRSPLSPESSKNFLFPKHQPILFTPINHHPISKANGFSIER